MILQPLSEVILPKPRPPLPKGSGARPWASPVPPCERPISARLRHVVIGWALLQFGFRGRVSIPSSSGLGVGQGPKRANPAPAVSIPSSSGLGVGLKEALMVPLLSRLSQSLLRQGLVSGRRGSESDPPEALVSIPSSSGLGVGPSCGSSARRAWRASQSLLRQGLVSGSAKCANPLATRVSIPSSSGLGVGLSL